MRPLRIAALVFGIVSALVALGLLAGGAVLVWAHSTQRDADGYFSTDTETVTSPGYAIVSEPVDLDLGPQRWFTTNIARFRVLADADGELFIGVGPTPDVRRYLAGAAHTVVTETVADRFETEEREADGVGSPARPTTQDFWVATARDGSLTWDVRSGEWSFVVMNADAGRPVTADLSVGVKTTLLFPIGIGLLIGGVVVAIVATLLIVAGVRRDRRAPPLPAGATPGRPDVPTRP